MRIESFRSRSPLRILLKRALHTPGSNVLGVPFLDGKRVLFLEPYHRMAHAPREALMNHPHHQALAEVFAAVKTQAAQRSMRLCVVLVPSKEEVYDWMLHDAPAWSMLKERSAFDEIVTELARRQDVPLLYMKPEMVAASRRLFETNGQLLYWRDDSHWNEQGHQIAADLISKSLSRRWCGPLRHV